MVDRYWWVAVILLLSSWDIKVEKCSDEIALRDCKITLKEQMSFIRNKLLIFSEKSEDDRVVRSGLQKVMRNSSLIILKEYPTN